MISLMAHTSLVSRISATGSAVTPAGALSPAASFSGQDSLIPPGAVCSGLAIGWSVNCSTGLSMMARCVSRVGMKSFGFSGDGANDSVRYAFSTWIPHIDERYSP